MFEVLYFVGNSVVTNKALVNAYNEVMVRGLIRMHENHAKITVLRCIRISDNVVYKVY